MVDGLMVRSSSIHAAGCYTTRRIKKGARVIEYDGPRFTKDEADERYSNRDITYLFSSGENEVVIDGFGTAMFINHSCDPNCESESIDGRVFIVAIRDIDAGEELTYECHLHDSDDEEAWQPDFEPVEGCHLRLPRREAGGTDSSTSSR